MKRCLDQEDKNNLSDFELLASCVPSFLDPSKYLTEKNIIRDEDGKADYDT